MTYRTFITRWRDPRAGRAVLVCAGSLALLGCGMQMDPGPIRTETRSVADFQVIELSGAADASIQVGPAASLTITAGENTLRELKSEVRDGTLKLDMKHGWFGNRGEVKLQLTTPALRRLEIGGAGNIQIHDVRGDSLQLVLNGAGNITAKGEVQSLDVQLNGAGNADLVGLQAQGAKVIVNGAGNVDVRVASSLDAAVNGVGAVRYAGKLGDLKTSINGVGEIKAIQIEEPAIEPIAEEPIAVEKD